MPGHKLFSADSHVSEPPDLWVERIDKAYRFRAPRVEAREKDGRLQEYMVYEGFPPHPVSVGLASAARDGDKAAYRDSGKGYSSALAGGWDPEARMKDQDVDGVEAEVLHATLCFRLFWIKDHGLQRACFTVYNDWLAAYCSYAPQRLIGVPCISLYDVNMAVAELQRTAKAGLKGAMIWLSPPAGSPDYDDPSYDRFWAAAQDMEAPLVLHGITGGAESRYAINYWDPKAILGSVVRHHEAERTLATFVLSGVLERFPGLKLICAENGTDWIPLFKKRLANASRRGPFLYPTQLSMLPTEYMQRQVFFTYINDQQAVRDRYEIGIDNLMWSSDYPHNASTWPRSQEVVDTSFEIVTDAVERQKLIRDNGMKLYGLSPVAVS
jgi:predicted TIM-barrel fold metal-dependent hydrolase